MNQVSITVPNDPAVLKATADYFRSLYDIAISNQIVAKLTPPPLVEQATQGNPFAAPAVNVPAPIAEATDLAAFTEEMVAKTFDIPVDILKSPIPPPAATDNAPIIPPPAEVTSPVNTTGVQLDSEGLPHDARIHSESKAILVKGGAWKLKRGVDPLVVDRVKTELRQAMSVGQTIAPPAAVNVPPPAATVTPPPPAASVVPPTTTTIVPPPAAVSDFPSFMVEVTKRKLEPASVLAVINKHGLASVQLLAVRPDLIPAVSKELFGGN